MLQNPNFPGLCPRWGSLQRSPEPLADGEGARCPSQEPHPRSRFYGSQSLTHHRVGNPTDDRFRIFSVSENGENGLGDEGAHGAIPPRIFGLEPLLGKVTGR